MMNTQAIITDFTQHIQAMLQDNLLSAYLFGSYNSSHWDMESDIDILLIVNSFDPTLRRQLSALASDYALEWGLIFSPIIKDKQVWAKNEYYKTLFYQEVTQKGIKLC